MKIKATDNNYMILKQNNSVKKLDTTSFGAEKTNYDDDKKCMENLGKAQVLMQNDFSQKKLESTTEIKNLLDKIFEPKGMKVSRCIGDKYISIGKPFEDFPDLCRDDVRAVCKRDKDGFLKEIYTLQRGGIGGRGMVSVYTKDGHLKKYFDEKDMDALFEYKYYPECFHGILRTGYFRGMQKTEEIQNWISVLDNLFEDDTKSFEIECPTVVYRALPDELSSEQLANLFRKGGIYTEKSYSSTTQNLETAKRFQRYNPILEIELPKGCKYIDMDALFNIDRKHWQEQEFLLPRNSQFEIVGYDEEKNVIKAKYLLDKTNISSSLFRERNQEGCANV